MGKIQIIVENGSVNFYVNNVFVGSVLSAGQYTDLPNEIIGAMINTP